MAAGVVGSGFWRVKIPAHAVGRHEIPAHEMEIAAPDRPHAKLKAVRHVYITLKVPPWKPYVRESFRLCQAEEYIPLSQVQRLKAEGKI